LSKLVPSRFVLPTGPSSSGTRYVSSPATLVRQLGVGHRGIKTDQRDAQALSEVSCRIDLPSVHIRSEQARNWKSISGARLGLVQARTQLVNNVRGWLRCQMDTVYHHARVVGASSGPRPGRTRLAVALSERRLNSTETNRRASPYVARSTQDRRSGRRPTHFATRVLHSSGEDQTTYDPSRLAPPTEEVADAA